uniref:BZIP domain-containing protein n=1 Tax=Haemonchus contortus TaxID=6289 RepID=A0A6F7P235_HAECO
MYQEGSSAIPGVPVDAPLTVKQHFQQQRKQQRNRARREARKQASGSVPGSQACVFSKKESTSKINSLNEQQDSQPTRALSEPAFSHQLQPQQMRPSTSRSADQELLRNTNMKVDPRLLGSFDSEDYGLMHGGATTIMDTPSDNKNPRMESVDSYESLFQVPDAGQMGQNNYDVQRSDAMRSYCSPYQASRCDMEDQTSSMHNPGEGTKLEYSIPGAMSNMYSSMDGVERNYGICDAGMSAVNGVSEQSHTDADPTTFDQGVEKLDTETDERFLSWLYCENEHAEDDDAEYTRVLEEIEKDECFPHKMEGETQMMDFGVPTCLPSTTQADVGTKVELDPSHPLASDCVVGEYASLPPSMPPRNPVPEGYSVTDFDSDLDLEMMPTGEDEETLYGRLLDVLVRDIKLLTYNNAALVDEVSRLNYAILVASEERKVLARRSCHHDRNRIRRLQTANKRKSDAQRRQQEQLTIAETQENIAQIKAKMAKSIVSPQRARPSASSAATRPALDVAAIKRSVEAEQRALEEKMPSKKPKRRAGSSRIPRKRPETIRSEKDPLSTQNSNVAKRGRLEADEARIAQEFVAPVENTSSTPLFESASSSRKSSRGYVSGLEGVDEQTRRRRSSRQLIHGVEGEDNDESTALMTSSAAGHDDVTAEDPSGEPRDVLATGDEIEQSLEERDDESQSWRRRSGRPPARAASAAAQTLLAAELATTEEVPTCSPKRGIRSRSNTSDTSSSRPVKRRGAVHPDSAERLQSEEPSPMSELTVEIMDDSLALHDSSPLEGDLELEPKDETAGDDVLPIGEFTDSESNTSRTPQRLRPGRRSARSSSRQSGGDAVDGPEAVCQTSASPSHQETEEKSEEPVARTTRSHGRVGISSTPQTERQMRERKQPSMYSPVARSTSMVQPRTVRRKS